MYLGVCLKPPLHRAAAFVPPLSDQKIRMLSSRPNPQSFVFMLLLQHDPCAFIESPKLLQLHNRSCKGGGSEAESLPLWLKGCRGRRMEAQWSPQWSLNGRYWSAKEDTVVVTFYVIRLLSMSIVEIVCHISEPTQDIASVFVGLLYLMIVRIDGHS